MDESEEGVGRKAKKIEIQTEIRRKGEKALGETNRARMNGYGI